MKNRYYTFDIEIKNRRKWGDLELTINVIP